MSACIALSRGFLHNALGICWPPCQWYELVTLSIMVPTICLHPACTCCTVSEVERAGPWICTHTLPAPGVARCLNYSWCDLEVCSSLHVTQICHGWNGRLQDIQNNHRSQQNSQLNPLSVNNQFRLCCRPTRTPARRHALTNHTLSRPVTAACLLCRCLLVVPLLYEV